MEVWWSICRDWVLNKNVVQVHACSFSSVRFVATEEHTAVSSLIYKNTVTEQNELQSISPKSQRERQLEKKKNKPSHHLQPGRKTVRQLHERKDWREDMRNRADMSLATLWQTERKAEGRRKEMKREKRRQGVEETAEKAKWCLCGVRKPCVVCLLIGRWGWGGLRATDQRDLQGFAPSSVEAVCQPLPLQHPPVPCPHPLHGAPCMYNNQWLQAMKGPPPSLQYKLVL